tara:strand:- start:168 stop:428 length:261 start_codon:yes stop_codon:yes gene_type:complete
MTEKFYRLTGIDSAIELLRPNAKWVLENGKFLEWNDDRPQPTLNEIKEVQLAAKRFEDSINTIWREQDKEEICKRLKILSETLGKV